MINTTLMEFKRHRFSYKHMLVRKHYGFIKNFFFPFVVLYIIDSVSDFMKYATYIQALFILNVRMAVNKTFWLVQS